MEKSKTVGGILLVAGTTIGAGMLAFPLGTGLIGFMPSLVLLLLFWLLMLYSAFLFLELTVGEEKETNLISMAEHTLGKKGALVAWILYLFLLYALLTAYLAGSAPLIVGLFNHLFSLDLSALWGIVPLLLVFGLFVYQGALFVDRANRFLMGGLALSFCVLVFYLIPAVQPSFLLYSDLGYFKSAVSVVATAFGFHVIIPTLVNYLHRDIRALKKVILIGSAIPLVVYIFWEALILGILPIHGEGGIHQGFVDGSHAVILVARLLQHPFLLSVASLFSFFAIITSFLGVSLSLMDFLKDGLKMRRDHMGRLFLFVLTFTPPIFFTLTDPRAFLSALEYAGGFGVVSMLALLPAAMCWSKRYLLKKKAPFQVRGGKAALVAVMVISVLVMLIEAMNKYE